MTTLRTLTLFVFTLFLLDGCSQRDDILLSASDELHSIKLFDKNSDFELCYNGFDIAIGKYQFVSDTIYLTYTRNKTLTQSSEGKNYSGTETELLTKKLVIDTAAKRIHSADGRKFCAFISSNKLRK